jgi:hypothetical protein
MTRSEILKAAHEVAKRDRRLYSSYREALADGIKAVHTTLRATDRGYGFEVREPWYKRTVFEQRGAGHRVVR